MADIALIYMMHMHRNSKGNTRLHRTTCTDGNKCLKELIEFADLWSSWSIRCRYMYRKIKCGVKWSRCAVKDGGRWSAIIVELAFYRQP